MKMTTVDTEDFDLKPKSGKTEDRSSKKYTSLAGAKEVVSLCFPLFLKLKGAKSVL